MQPSNRARTSRCRRVLAAGSANTAPAVAAGGRCSYVLALALLASCGGYAQRAPDQQAQRAIATVSALNAWEQTHGPAAQCGNELRSLRWRVVDADAVADVCATLSTITGCFNYDGTTPVVTVVGGVVRSDEQAAKLYRHELTHWLLCCSGVDPTGDPHHTRAEWAELL